MIIGLADKKLSTRTDDFWIAPSASVIGDVQLGDKSSIWFNSTIRGDNEPIIIGDGSNIQDNSVLHTDPGCPCIVEDNVTVGHMVMLHGCIIGSGSLVGIGAVILNNVIVGKNCIIGAKALITEGTIIPDGSMVMGMPGKIKRELTPEEQELTKMNAEFYVQNYKRYKSLNV